MTWTLFKQNQSYESTQGELFVNYNRRLNPFIRGRRGVDETKTFNYSKRGFERAVKWLNREEL